MVLPVAMLMGLACATTSIVVVNERTVAMDVRVQHAEKVLDFGSVPAGATRELPLAPLGASPLQFSVGTGSSAASFATQAWVRNGNCGRVVLRVGQDKHRWENWTGTEEPDQPCNVARAWASGDPFALGKPPLKSTCLSVLSFNASFGDVPVQEPPSLLRLLETPNLEWSQPERIVFSVGPGDAFFGVDAFMRERTSGLWFLDEQKHLVIRWTTGFQVVTLRSEKPFASSREPVAFSITEFGDAIGSRDAGRAMVATIPCR